MFVCVCQITSWFLLWHYTYCNARRPFPTLQKFTFTINCLISSCYTYSGCHWVCYKPVWAAKVVCLHMAHSGFGLFDPSEWFIVGYFHPIVILTIFCGQVIVSLPNEVNRLGGKKKVNFLFSCYWSLHQHLRVEVEQILVILNF